MNTEKKSERYNNIDLWETKDILQAILESQLNAVSVIENVIEEIDLVVTKSIPLLKAGGRLIFAGAGTSGRIAAQECSELFPTFSWPKDKTMFLLAGGPKALTEAVENAEDNIENGEKEAKKIKVNRKDIIICLAASGRTPFTLGVLREANLAGALTIGISSTANTPLLNEALIKLFIDTGAEVITGSTRMKAGTAQKILLNMITTTIMIRLHHVYDSYMVDLNATNAKLIKRSVNMVSDICKVDNETALAAIEKCKGNAKLACVFIKYKNLKTAEKLLKENDGNLRKCLDK
ncbi:N-acetylmuramic acid 6-phosphate etherase [Fluviispira multicolorata]|uniref:N-acetylmuramic acid 6-phosphate etherase n=1 Tax=Fluviispira multicolorata TaxID=2654512 RepID=A0A833N732_9BACT|nr:N-acetylmuramic acid 6-phosphate etherase [Fluviispira multicolorata]KAB8031765.1 N-acetylmuramic acid 6-phosphate etherase [Fluviispira multicolorata]